MTALVLPRSRLVATGWRPHLYALGFAAAAILLLFYHDAQAIVAIWWNSATFNHCLLIPFILGWLVAQRKGALAQLTPAAWWPGLLLVAAGAFGWMLGEAGAVASARHLGLIFMLQGAVIAILGKHVARGLAFPLFFALFLVPFGEELIPAMQTVTAQIASALLSVTGVPAHLEGIFITTPTGYFQVAEACAGVVVASTHERARLRRAGIGTPVDVIPLPIVPLAAPTTQRRATRRRSVAILGFVYPGKGHAEVIAAVGSLPPDVQVVALGRASDGHQPLVDCLRRTATSTDRRLLVTGYLDDATLADALHQVDVPVVAARSVSASASAATWIAAGRRPLVARNAYATELAAYDADLVTLYDPEHLTSAIERAIDDPSTTRRRGPIPQALQLSAVAEAHCELYRRTAR